jgi:predicted nuclease of predicted toxin-antitoxin system
MTGRIVVTLDADFHAILVVSGMSAPSVIRIRLEGVKGPAIAAIIRDVLAAYAPDLAVGCMITVKEQKTTCHLLRASD